MTPCMLAHNKASTLEPRPSMIFERLLEKLSIEEVLAANTNPVECLYPYARLCVMRYNWKLADIRSLTNWKRSSYEDWEPEHLNDSRVSSREIIAELTASYRCLSRHSDSWSNRWKNLKCDYDEALAQAGQFEDDFRDHMSTYVGIINLKESKKSIQQADSVRRVTLLAFVFVPLTFVTSIFGMNLQSFGTGNIKLWLFLTVAGITSFTVLIMLLISSHFLNWYHNHFKTVRVLLALSKYLPKEALWFSIFCMYHSRKTQGQLLGGLGLYYRLLSNRSDWLSPYAFRAAGDTGLRLKIDLSPFWLRKAEVVWQFFSQNNWEYRTFYWRYKNEKSNLRNKQ